MKLKARTYQSAVLCEPQLGRRGLYPTVSTKTSGNEVRTMMNFLAYADGTNDLLALADRIGANAMECAAIAETLRAHELLTIVDG